MMKNIVKLTWSINSSHVGGKTLLAFSYLIYQTLWHFNKHPKYILLSETKPKPELNTLHLILILIICLLLVLLSNNNNTKKMASFAKDVRCCVICGVIIKP